MDVRSPSVCEKEKDEDVGEEGPGEVAAPSLPPLQLLRMDPKAYE